MYRIKAPASTSNLSAGFDVLGLALNIYNCFEVELNDRDILINVEDEYNNENNLFLKAYHTGTDHLGIHDHIKAEFKYDVPIERGLGSSSTLIVGGLMAASVLHENRLDKDEIFQLASKMEGHPDNVAPCIYGGFTASNVTEGKFYTRHLQIDEDYHFTVFIPDFAVSTAEARGILPKQYERSAAVHNTAKAIYLIEALRNGDMELLKKCYDEDIHEPYRKSLIYEFNEVKKLFEKDSDGVLFISGSGSTCFGISKRSVSEDLIKNISKLEHNWQIREVHIDHEGVSANEI